MTDQILANIALEIKNRIESYSPVYESHSVGNVVEASDGIARVAGLSDVRSQE
jgi:F0F1-type ATP synthase alpha subunit